MQTKRLLPLFLFLFFINCLSGQKNVKYYDVSGKEVTKSQFYGLEDNFLNITTHAAVML